MSKTITGTWLYSSGLPVVSGKLYLTLSQDAVVIGTGQVAPSTYEITLNASGQIPGSTTILANDELNPSGTVYQATVIAVGGGRVWGEQPLSITGGSPINLNLLVPVSTPGGVVYISLAEPQFNVKVYGAKGDGPTTDDTAAFQAAITAAEAINGSIYVPLSSSYYKITSGFQLKRSTRVVCAPGASVKLAASSGTLFTFGANSDGSWLPGGIDLCSLSGNGGGADTSVGIQIGNAANSAHGVNFDKVDIAGFGTGVVVSGTGDAFSWAFDKSRIHNNACDGIRIDTTPGDIESPALTDTMVFNNGNSSATCTGIRWNTTALGYLTIKGGSINNNGNGTLGQVHVPAGATAHLFISAGAHFEKAGGADSSDIVILTQGGPRSELVVSDTDFLANPTTPLGTKPIIKFAAANVQLSNNRFYMSAGASASPMIDVGASVASNGIFFVSRNNHFKCVNGTANCQAISMTGSGTFINYDISGTSLEGFLSSTAIYSIPAGAIGIHDLLLTGASLLNVGGPTGTLTLTGAFVGNLTGNTSGSAGSVLFSGVGAATNANALVIGTGGSLTVSGSGTINSTTLLGNTWAAPGAIGSGTPGSGAFTSLTTTGLLTNYNSIATVSNGIPAEYATVDLTGQGAAIGTTTLYAVPASGVGQYRVSWNAKVTTPATTGAVTSTLGGLTIVYTDPDGVPITITAQGQTPGGTYVSSNGGNTTGSAILGFPLTLNCKESTNITYAMAYASDAAGEMKYNLHIKLEKL